jgi:hypothetical protein
MLPYSAEWLEQLGAPMIAIEPRDYAPEVYDFRCVVGCQVRLIDMMNTYRDVDVAEKHWGPFYDLVGELSDWAAEVKVSPLDRFAHDIAWEQRYFEAGRYVWPRWWSDQRQREHDRRFLTWLDDSSRAALSRAA